MDSSITKFYEFVIFSKASLEELLNLFLKSSGANDQNDVISELRLYDTDSNWNYETMAEFLADYGEGVTMFYIRFSYEHYSLEISSFYRIGFPHVNIKAPSRVVANILLNQIDNNVFSIKHLVKSENEEPIIFIGHGRDSQWIELKNHLHDLHDFQIEAYETDTRAGMNISEILKDLLNKCNLAILVFTGENEFKDGSLHPRENVIYELGFFQAKLGFNHALILLEEGTEYFSNIDGIQQIRFSKCNIKATFGEVVATIRREFEKI